MLSDLFRQITCFDSLISKRTVDFPRCLLDRSLVQRVPGRQFCVTILPRVVRLFILLFLGHALVLHLILFAEFTGRLESVFIITWLVIIVALDTHGVSYFN